MATPPEPLLESTPVTQLREHHPQAWELLLTLLPAPPPAPPPALLGEMLDQLAEDRNTLLYRLNVAAGLAERFLPRLPVAERSRLTRELPTPGDATPARLAQFLASVPRKAVTALDAAPLLAAGQDPFGAIMARVQVLPPGGVLLLRIPFKPLPLLRLMAEGGFSHLIAPEGAGWVVALFRAPSRQTGESAPAAAADLPLSGELDLRGLPPPEPMLRILAATSRLSPGGALRVILGRVPHLLLPRLQERGLHWEVTGEGEGRVLLTIVRPPLLDGE